MQKVYCYGVKYIRLEMSKILIESRSMMRDSKQQNYWQMQHLECMEILTLNMLITKWQRP